MAAQTFDNRDGWIWMDGQMVNWRDAKVHVLTHALHYASAVFEGERAYGGTIFKSTAHSRRLRESAQILDFELPWSVAEIDAAKAEVLKRNNLADAYVRAVAWRGSEMMGVAAQDNAIHLGIAVWEWPSYFDPAQRMKGIRLDIADYRRPDPATAPALAKAAGLYMICTISKHRAERRGYADALMLDWQGRVAECTGANVFFVKNGTIYTPIADCFLSGITRATVIDLARKRGFEVIERRILPAELGEFDECFITGTAAEVTPVGEIGPHHYKPAAVTAALIDAYTEEVNPRTKAAYRSTGSAAKRAPRPIGAAVAASPPRRRNCPSPVFDPPCRNRRSVWSRPRRSRRPDRICCGTPAIPHGSLKTANLARGPTPRKSGLEVWDRASPLPPTRAAEPRRGASRACHNGRQTPGPY